MDFELDEPERLALTWNGTAMLEAAKANWHREWRARLTADCFARIPARPIVREASRSAPVPQGKRLEPWSAYSAAVLGASFPQPGDPDFVPGTAWQALEHSRAMAQ